MGIFQPSLCDRLPEGIQLYVFFSLEIDIQYIQATNFNMKEFQHEGNCLVVFFWRAMEYGTYNPKRLTESKDGDYASRANGRFAENMDFHGFLTGVVS